MLELKGRVVLVTGGASGLGAAIAREVAEAGAVAVLGDIDIAKARAVAAAIQADGGTAAALPLDVGDPAQGASAVEGVLERHGRLDVLVNNAGIDRTVAFEELTLADWDRVLRVNLHGPFLMSRLVFPHMRRRGAGHIVNIASTAAKRAWAKAAAYHASKWGLLGLSHALHVEGRPHGVKVTAIVAGGMRTPFLLERFPELDPAALQDPRDVARAIRFVLTQPAGTVIPEVTVLPMREQSWP
jgi:NAD(P)-dependent dehydrogenase (short-subunit alcohol dehydrogenase family)